MSYFSYLPNVYVRTGPRKGSTYPYVLSKNIFRRIAIREKIQQLVTIFEKYEIKEGYKPFQVASEVYGDSGYDWIVLIVNNITNVWDQWPLSDEEMREHADELYGLEKESIHHYETIEVKTADGIVVLPEGITVNSDFTYIDPKTQIPLTGLNIRMPITNFEYLSRLNDSKRSIYLLKPTYVNNFIQEFQELTQYANSRELDEFGNKKTPAELVEESL
jgi:hypothetical protein